MTESEKLFLAFCEDWKWQIKRLVPPGKRIRNRGREPDRRTPDDVHKDTVMVSVLPEGAREPTLVKRLSHDPRGLRRMLGRLARAGEVRACYEASGAGYVLERMIRSWGYVCEIVAPSLIPRRPGERRKHEPQGRRGAGAAVPGGRAVDDPGAVGAGGAGA